MLKSIKNHQMRLANEGVRFLVLNWHWPMVLIIFLHQDTRLYCSLRTDKYLSGKWDNVTRGQYVTWVHLHRGKVLETVLGCIKQHLKIDLTKTYTQIFLNFRVPKPFCGSS